MVNFFRVLCLFATIEQLIPGFLIPDHGHFELEEPWVSELYDPVYYSQGRVSLALTNSEKGAIEMSENVTFSRIVSFECLSARLTRRCPYLQRHAAEYLIERTPFEFHAVWLVRFLAKTRTSDSATISEQHHLC
jgi:hypothetical protein